MYGIYLRASDCWLCPGKEAGAYVWRRSKLLACKFIARDDAWGVAEIACRGMAVEVRRISKSKIAHPNLPWGPRDAE